MHEPKLLRQLLDRAPVVAFIKSRDHRYLVANKRMCEVFGIPRDELIGRTDTDVFQADAAKRIAAAHDDVLRERRPITVEEVVTFNGVDETFLTSRFPLFDDDGEVVAVGGIAVPITDRARAERELQESEARYRHMLEHAPHAFVSFNVHEGGFTYVNDNACKLFGAPREALLGSSPAELSPTLQPDGRPSPEAAMEHISRGLAGEDVVFDWVHQTVDGEPRPVKIWLGGEASGDAWASMLDMREVLQAQHKIERQNTLLDRTQALAKVGGWEIDLGRREVRWTREAFRIHGVDPADFTPTLDTVFQCYAGSDGDTLRRTALKLGEGESFDLELRVSTPDAQQRAVRIVGTREQDYVLGAIQDISAQRRLEEQLRQSQRLESLGRLAGGIAHDFNNLLTVISNSVAFLEASLPHDAKADVADIRQATRRASDLTTQMLAFARRQGGTARAIDPNAVIERTARMLGRMVGDDIRVDTELQAGLGAVRTDPAHLEQVLVNLVVNARDAMPGGGTLVLRSSRVEAPPEEVENPKHTGAWLCIEVVDSGQGMSDDVRRRIFEPFFTTKPPGQGTGLGLSTVYGILRRWGGGISVVSVPGVGTAMRTWWPEYPISLVEDSDNGPDDPPSLGDETILLVEDDDAVRRVTARGLRSAGFEVVVADGPEVAEALVAARDTPFDLLVTDVVMPGIGGLELAIRLQDKDPDLRVLFVSGYASDALEARGMSIARFELLQKPFDLRELTSRVRELLDR